MREGIILRLANDQGKVGFGEIAPIPWFGTETLEEALEFCQQLPSEITDRIIFSISDQLPACQFGFESAFQQSANHYLEPLLYSRLLPAGSEALNLWKSLFEQELSIFHQLTQNLPKSTRLRLDANGALSYDEAQLWLQACDDAQSKSFVKVEYLEQPLPPEQFDAMEHLSKQYSTSIALDESVATLKQLQTCYENGWQGLFVIKPSIAGSPTRLRQFCQETQIDTVFSSAFETAIGRKAALNLAADMKSQSMGKIRDRAVGFGTDHWLPTDSPFLNLDGKELWEKL
jgi:O-succinylbenzoate synthase